MEATALYRLGKPQDADALAATLETSSDADAAAGASFLRGLIADEAGNDAGLGDALGRLSGASAPLRVADRLELQSRLALRQDDPMAARSAAMQAAALRQEALDYRGMARALSRAGDAALRSGRSADAADFFLRAGRSALLQGDTAAATPLLKRAEDLGKQTGQTGIVDEVSRLRRAATERTTRT